MSGVAPTPDKALGQHFLFDRGILDRIVEASGLEEGEAALEIGPGPGGLTRALIDGGARLWAVEADRRMVAHLEASDLGDAKIIQGDALKTDYLLLAEEAGEPFRLVANLPYNISGPLLALLLKERRAFKSMTLMFQKEVADRVCAPEGNKVRGKLSVLAQAFCKVRKVMNVSPGAFRPPPKVDSTVIHLDVLDAPLAPLKDEKTLWSIVGEGFGQRRKMLRNTLKKRVGPEGEAFFAVGLKGTERAESLTVLQWIALANAIFNLEPDQ